MNNLIYNPLTGKLEFISKGQKGEKGERGHGGGGSTFSGASVNDVIRKFSLDPDTATYTLVSTTEKATWNGKEDSSNKVTSISAGSTDTQYPSAKLVYDQLALKLSSESDTLDTVLGRGATSTTVPTLSSGIKTPIIYPASDSTTALKLTKADGATAILTGDTTNSRIGIGVTPSCTLDVYGYGHIGQSADTPIKTLTISGNLNFDTVAEPTAAQQTAMVLTNTGAGSIEAGTYYYAVKYYTAEGDTGHTTGYNTLPNITSADAFKVTVSNIPCSPDPRVVGRKVYRSQAGTVGDYYFCYYIGTIADNTTTTYNDNSPKNTSSTDWIYNKNNTTAGITYRDGAVYTRLADYMTAFGKEALKSVTKGSTNAAFGSSALASCTTGGSNQAFGHAAAANITEGAYNCAMGYASLQGNKTGHLNVAIGNNAQRNETSASNSYNTAIGGETLKALTTNNNYNTAIGYQAGNNSQASGGIYVGYAAGYRESAGTVGNYNIVIGHAAGSSISTGAKNILIGYDVEFPTAANDNQLNIGNIIYGINMNNGSTPASTGKVGIGVAVPTERLQVSGNAFLTTDSDKFIMGTGKDMTIYYDGTSGYIDLNDVAASDLHIQCGTDKTLVLDESVYNDANVGALVLRTGGTAAGVVEWLDNDGDATGIYTLGFAVNEQGSGSIEIPHDYKEGTNLTFHIHWGANDAPSGTDYVKWQLIYNVQRDGTTFVDATTLSASDTAYDTQYKTTRTDFTAITGTNFKIGDQFNFTIKRITADGDAFTGEALIQTLGFHYECDTIGSRQIGTK
jgi:hypothetical protein